MKTVARIVVAEELNLLSGICVALNRWVDQGGLFWLWDLGEIRSRLAESPLCRCAAKLAIAHPGRRSGQRVSARLRRR
jgi:hypothetical protein